MQQPAQSAQRTTAEEIHALHLDSAESTGHQPTLKGLGSIDRLQNIDLDHHINMSSGERMLLRQSHPVIDLQTRHGRMASGRLKAGAGRVDPAQTGAPARQKLSGDAAAAAHIQHAKIPPLGNESIEKEKAKRGDLAAWNARGVLDPPTTSLLIVG
ncbi:hypothetical protein [Synechococcus sp. CS-1332]|uniref:hypothetical protein n=1 Tax=Synechococcus sp. CS-1332 TaxID=2847972 RepID=UPI00223BA56E|nr:hypothetical protein [Synechococcus sp. CS-1332]MCT0208150.1 hypothetical protein [Synechococcus sp. CS-1332]